MGRSGQAVYALLVLALILAAGRAPAVTIEQMQVSREDQRYTIDAAMILAVPRATAWQAATDYERLPEFNSSVLDSQRLAGDRLRSNIRFCVAFFCKTVEQVMRYRETPGQQIAMQVVPGAGDLKSGHVDWRFDSPAPRTTRLSMQAEIVPDFWVPPLIGPYLIARELRRQAQVTAESIERLASDYGAGQTLEESAATAPPARADPEHDGDAEHRAGERAESQPEQDSGADGR